MQAERTRTEWFIWHIRQIPFQLAHLRELTETPIAAVDTSVTRIMGGNEQARLPYRVDPADDADLLWTTLILFAREVAEHTGNPAPKATRTRMWNGKTEPQGLPLCTPTEAFSLAAEIIQWLEVCARQIVHGLGQAPDNLVDHIREIRSRYPRSEPRFKAYRPHPCPICGERTIEPIWGAGGLAGVKCDSCGQRWIQPGISE